MWVVLAILGTTERAAACTELAHGRHCLLACCSQSTDGLDARVTCFLLLEFHVLLTCYIIAGGCSMLKSSVTYFPCADWVFLPFVFLQQQICLSLL
jgi:hypothetical protein